jgi:hypothetical protein
MENINVSSQFGIKLEGCIMVTPQWEINLRSIKIQLLPQIKYATSILQKAIR